MFSSPPQTLKLVRRRACFTMPSGEGMPEAIPAEITDSCPQQRIAPSLRIDLDDWIALISENMSRVIAVPPLQYLQSCFIERHRMRPAVLCSPPDTHIWRCSRLTCFQYKRVTLACLRPVATENCALSARCEGNCDIGRSYSSRDSDRMRPSVSRNMPTLGTLTSHSHSLQALRPLALKPSPLH